MFELYTCTRRYAARLGDEKDVKEIWDNMVGNINIEEICREIDSDNVKHIKIVITDNTIHIKVDEGQCTLLGHLSPCWNYRHE